MPSPFPGMDPYLEAFWGDFHGRFIVYASDALQTLLPEGLRALTQERIYVETPAVEPRPIYPDIHVVEWPTARGAPGGGIAVMAAEPVVIRVDDEPVTENYIEIIDVKSGRRVVTVIEILSPSNKRGGEGERQYLRKQQERIDAEVSAVEIDLLRAGHRVLAVPPDRIPPSHRSTYLVGVRRGWEGRTFRVYRAALRERLPVIRVPLRASDPEVTLDLQAVVDQVYRNVGYDGVIDYRADPVPPLDPDDAAWADDLLRTKGLR